MAEARSTENIDPRRRAVLYAWSLLADRVDELSDAVLAVGQEYPGRICSDLVDVREAVERVLGSFEAGKERREAKE